MKQGRRITDVKNTVLKIRHAEQSVTPLSSIMLLQALRTSLQHVNSRCILESKQSGYNSNDRDRIQSLALIETCVL